MKNKLISKIFEDYNSGKITEDYAIDKILNLNYLDKEPIANIDFQREERSGFPEVVFGLNKTNEQIAIMIIVHTSVLKSPLVRDAANPAVTIVTAVCIVNIVAIVIIAYAIRMPLPNL